MATENTDAPRQARHQIRETGGLLGDIFDQLGRLVRGEVDLLRAEVDQNVKQAFTAIGLLVAAVVILLVALNILAGALVVAIAEMGLAPGLAALIVGVALAVIAAIMAKKGQSDLKATSLAPTRTVQNVQRDGETVKKAL